MTNWREVYDHADALDAASRTVVRQAYVGHDDCGGRGGDNCCCDTCLAGYGEER